MEKVDFFRPKYIIFDLGKKKLKQFFSKFLTNKMSNIRASGQKWPNLGQIWVNFGQKGPLLKFPQKSENLNFF